MTVREGFLIDIAMTLVWGGWWVVRCLTQTSGRYVSLVCVVKHFFYT